MSNSAGFTTQAKTSTGTGTNTGTSTGTGTDTGTGTGTGPRTGTKPVGDTTIIDHPEGLTEEELDLEETIEDLDVLIDESIDNEASSIDEDDRGECSQDDDEPSVDDAFEWCRALDDEDKDSIDVKEGLPIRVYPEKDVYGNVRRYRCFVKRCSIGHQSNSRSDAIANRDRIVGAVANWVEENRQKFLQSFDVRDLGGDSDEQAYQEAMTALMSSNNEGEKGLKKCPVLQNGLLGLIGEKDGQGKGSQNPNFSKYMKELCLRSVDLGKDLYFQVLFSRGAQFSWASAAISGFIKEQTKGRRSNQEFLRSNSGGPIKGKRGRRPGAWQNNINDFIQRIITPLRISYKDIETTIKER